MRAASVVLALATIACSRNEHTLSADPAPPIAGLEVQSGRPFRLEDHRGKVVLVSFGYTACVELCPDTFSTAKTVFTAAGDAARDLAFAYVTVDPERDTPQAFHDFMKTVDGRFEGVFVDPAKLPVVLDAYHVVVRKRLPDPERYARRNVDPSAFYAMDHTAGFWLVDRRGRLRYRFDHESPDAQVVEAAVRLLGEES